MNLLSRMADPAKAQPPRADEGVLIPFTPPHEANAAVRRRRWLAALCVICFLLYGFFFAFFAPFFLPLLVVPIGILALLVVWQLPEFQRPPASALELLFYAFIGSLIVWPNYLAIALPGLPWITLIRLTGFPLALLFLVCLSVSRDFRSDLYQSANGLPLLWKAVLAFAVVQLLSIALSAAKLASIQKFVLAQIEWTAVFFISCYVFRRPGRVERWAMFIWLLAVIVSVIGVMEYLKDEVLWANHVPSFLKIDDPWVLHYLAGSAREANGIHRVQSTSSTPLGLAEFIALTMPFIVHFIVARYQWQVKLAAIVTVPLLLFVILTTDSRLGVVGCLFSFALYPLYWGLRRWRLQRGSILGPAMTLAYPAFFIALMAATVFWRRLHTMVWGGGAQQASTDSRIDQMNLAIPMILHNPLGFGIGMGADALGYYNESGELTIDSYYLMMLLDFGFIGFVLYFGTLAYAIYAAGRNALHAPPDRDFELLAPIAIALTNFLVVKSVFAQQDNHTIVFVLLGAVAALIYRIKQGAAVSPDAQAASAAVPARLGAQPPIR